MPFAVAAYLIWGAFPAYFPLLEPASPMEILANRVLWTAAVMLVVIMVGGHARELRLASARTWATMVVLGVLIAANWLIYVIAVNSGHVADAALGYFMNPLVNVVLGMVFLRERLRLLQWIAVVIAGVAVVMLTVVGGHPPWIGLGLALSFGFYGLVKKRVHVGASASLAAETLVLVPVAAGYLWWLTGRGLSTFMDHGLGHSVLLASTGVVTAVPLLLFGMGARRIPLSTIGMLQYMTPSLQMLWAVAVKHEHITAARWVGFGIIWVSVAVYLLDLALQARSVRVHKARRRGERVADGSGVIAGSITGPVSPGRDA